MYFVKRGDRYIDVAGQSFRDLMAGQLPGMPGERATMSDWANHISTIFPEVRLKRYLEMRGADGGPWRRLPRCRPIGSAFSTTTARSMRPGIWSRTGAPRSGRNCATRCRGSASRPTIARPQRAAAAKTTLALAEQGLARRRRFDADGQDESRYLRPIQEYVARGITPAEELLEKFHGAWNGASRRYSRNTPIEPAARMSYACCLRCDGARAGAGPGWLRSAGRRLHELVPALWRPCAMREPLRARLALPRLGVFLSGDRDGNAVCWLKSRVFRGVPPPAVFRACAVPA